MIKRFMLVLVLVGCLGCVGPECPKPKDDSSALLGHYRATLGVMAIRTMEQQNRIDELEGLVGWYVERDINVIDR